jgi:hypothetical protein
MSTRRCTRLAMICGLAAWIAATTPAAGRGGGGARGGGMRAGGGGYGGGGYGGAAARPAYSGNGSIRYSRPSTPSYSRPATPSYARPSTPSYARPSTPAAARRPAYTPTAVRPSTPSYVRPSTPVAQPLPVARPPNYGSISRGGVGGIGGGSITTPGGSTIGGIKGPGGGGAVGIKGPGGGVAGGIKGPGGGGAAGIAGPGGGAAGGIRGPGGGTAGGIRGPGGGAAGGIVGAGGGAAGGIRGPGGGAAGGVVGPGGGGAAGIRGPSGGAGAIWGPGGAGIAGARGPYGGFVAARLPDGAVHYPWHGHDYWHAGYIWYSPCWIGDDVYYNWIYPPIGYYYPALPPEYSTVVVDNSTYYYSEGVYYQEGDKDGQEGYVVAEAPEGQEPAKSEDPFQILKRMCDYLDGLQEFSVVANTTADEVQESGAKIQLSARRTICVSRPDKISVFVTGDYGEKRLVYNGRTVSMYDRNKNVYTVIPVPDSINAALDTLADDYGIVVPLEELLYQDAYTRLVAHAAVGQYLGLRMFGIASCHHLAFATDTLDWEIWIEAGNKPLPRKVTIDYKQYAGKPRYAAVISWNESAKFESGRFEYMPLSGTQRIEIAPVRAAASQPAP